MPVTYVTGFLEGFLVNESRWEPEGRDPTGLKDGKEWYHLLIQQAPVRQHWCPGDYSQAPEILSYRNKIQKRSLLLGAYNLEVLNLWVMTSRGAK